MEGASRTWLLVFLALASACSLRASDWSGDCDGPGPCPTAGPDEALCPPDSAPDSNGTCACLEERCARPTCKYGARRELRRRGSGLPGDCCDVYECVSPRERNCSGVWCPDEKLDCPRDSYRLPSHRAPGDCCSVPQGCQCLPAPCPIASCAPGQHANVVRLGNGRPGTCCPLFECVPKDADEGCITEAGLAVANGSSWWKDECTQCSCDAGKMLCAVTHCPEAPASCSEVRKMPNECCPVCVSDLAEGEAAGQAPHGCVSSRGQILRSGDSWQEDPCTSCVCAGGRNKCQAYMCEVSCDNPDYVPDECCPLCNSTSVVVVPPHCPALNNCSLKCLQGFVRDAAGCFQCRCEAEECVLDCRHGYERDGLGNKLCQCAAAPPTPPACPPLAGCHRSCPHGYRAGKDGCPACRCSQCRQLTDCAKTCVHGLRTNDRGCAICKCRASAKSPVDISPTTHISYSPCVSSDGRAHDEGETWFDGCRECYCHGGLEMCNLIACPAPNCSEPALDAGSGDCCPRCAGEEQQAPAAAVMVCQSVDGAYRVEGESWQLDPCTRCLCHAGRVLCETRRCPPAPCERPETAAGCCPSCPPVSRDPAPEGCGEGRPHGAAWRDGACRSCECVAGRVRCFGQACPPAACPRPLLLKNHCCPVCLDGGAPQVCEVGGNTTYLEGESWSEGPCLHCVCAGGARSCKRVACQRPCPDPADPCCLGCPGEDGAAARGLSDVAYIAVISLLCCVIACLALYIWCGCRRRRRRLQLGGTCSGPPAYSGFPHPRDHALALPPRYVAAERHYRYKTVPVIRSPSIRSTEKSALAPI
ncbi:cysteine-rich motor neuron 1 protein-like isoform X2 [Bacillus rossius redtenbacheri]|uniref:cysteine-rich motor neuron 1 protein-like isoform X2 n=1 Tax=Bacillus rossius redtenbacheri TaxID=93214 RepID=UPI002FDCF4DA